MSTELTTYEDTDAIVRLVLDGLTSEHSKRAYEKALTDFLAWHAEQGLPPLSKALVQRYRVKLESDGLAPSTVNLRLSAIRKLAREAADNGLIDPLLANGIKAVKGVKAAGVRSGNWLTREQAQAQLIHSEKVAALGRLTASIAHEINNPLQAVQGCLVLVEEELGEGQRREKMDRYLDVAGSEIERIVVGLVAKLLTPNPRGHALSSPNSGNRRTARTAPNAFFWPERTTRSLFDDSTPVILATPCIPLLNKRICG